MKLNKKNSLAVKNPKLAKQWHPNKNGKLTPKDVTTGSGKKVWWKCEKGHEWEAIIGNRAKNRGCPYCAGKSVGDDNSLHILNPELSKQWHPTKNGELTPHDVTEYSNKKVWWKCKKGHEWEASIAKRTSGRGCPYCAGKNVCDDNSMYTLNPELSKQWHTIKNGELTPHDVTTGSSKKIWWQCEKGHEWEASIANRSKGVGCPYCSNQRVCVDNSLQSLNSELSKQWHPTKNGELTPNDVISGSGQKVWWQCEKGHEWKASIAKRTSGRGCPTCASESKTSFPEQAIYFYLKELFVDTLNRYRYNDKWEIDVFVPSLNFGIEYNGIFYHKNRKIFDSKKERYLKKKIFFLTIREIEKSKKKYRHKNGVIYCNVDPWTIPQPVYKVKQLSLNNIH